LADYRQIPRLRSRLMPGGLPFHPVPNRFPLTNEAAGKVTGIW
jgi:hypothetical protein